MRAAQQWAFGACDAAGAGVAEGFSVAAGVVVGLGTSCAGLSMAVSGCVQGGIILQRFLAGARQVGHVADNRAQRQNARRGGCKHHGQTEQIQTFFPEKLFDVVHLPPSFTCESVVYAVSVDVPRGFIHDKCNTFCIIWKHNTKRRCFSAKFPLHFCAKPCIIYYWIIIEECAPM